MSCGIGHRRSSDPELLGLWRKAGGYSSDWTPSLGTSTCPRCGPKKTKRQKKKKEFGIRGKNLEQVEENADLTVTQFLCFSYNERLTHQEMLAPLCR